MKQFMLFLAIIVATVATPAWASGPWQRFYQNIKLPSQAVLEHMSWAAPAVASTTLLKNAATLATSAATTISSFSAQPDFARNIVLTVGGTAASVGAGTAVVSGTNILGQAISENFTITLHQAGATTGAKAFKTVTSVVFPATSGSGATLSIGTGVKLGLSHCAANAGDYVFSEFAGAYDSTRGTLAVSSSAVESNTFSGNSAPDGSSAVDLYYLQNYACY